MPCKHDCKQAYIIFSDYICCDNALNNLSNKKRVFKRALKHYNLRQIDIKIRTEEQIN